MQHQCPHRGVIRIRQLVDERMQAVSPLRLLVGFGSVDEALVGFVGEQGVRELLEELLEERGGDVDVVVEVRWVPEVDC